MMTKRIQKIQAIVLLLVFGVGQGLAQVSRTFHLVDSVLTARYRSSDIDTNYILRPLAKWTVKARFNVSGAGIEANSLFDGIPVSSHVRADYKGTMSLAVTYMGVSLGGSLNPGAILGRYKDYEFNLNSYGNRMGFDFIYQRAKNFTGWLQYGEQPKTDLPRNLMDVHTVNVNGYYAFNHPRFSYPAAFAQSYIQRAVGGQFHAGRLVSGAVRRDQCRRDSRQQARQTASSELRPWRRLRLQSCAAPQVACPPFVTTHVHRL